MKLLSKIVVWIIKHPVVWQFLLKVAAEEKAKASKA